MKNIKINEKVSIKLNSETLEYQTSEMKKAEKVKSKSEMFRILYDAGMEVAEIAAEMDSHYSFVYGVISSSREMRKVNKITKSDQIRELAKAGKTPGEIAKELNSNYSFVHTVVRKYKESLEVPEKAAK